MSWMFQTNWSEILHLYIYDYENSTVQKIVFGISYWHVLYVCLFVADMYFQGFPYFLAFLASHNIGCLPRYVFLKSQFFSVDNSYHFRQHNIAAWSAFCQKSIMALLFMHVSQHLIHCQTYTYLLNFYARGPFRIPTLFA